MIFSYEKNQREGKSHGMVSLAFYLGSLVGYPDLYANFQIFNYPGKFCYFETWAELGEPANAIICYDEIGKTHDARLYQSKDQIRFTHFFSEIGKRGNTLIYTAQRDFLVEKRVREQTDIVIHCYKNWATGQMYQQWWDCRRSRDNPVLIGRYMVPNDERTQQIFQNYNSYEVIRNEEHFNDQLQKNYRR